ncbi:hypothetical protein BT69DRAFT_1257573 [Atractiella rhizophila]|nr:hypothetical protein BT69DRAFT_1257573 [Atractiella rhizophila]
MSEEKRPEAMSRSSSLTVQSTDNDRKDLVNEKEAEKKEMDLQETDLENQRAQQPNQPQKFSHNFWDPAIAPQRRMYLKAAFLRALAILLLQLFVAMPFYWGSLYREYALVPNLRALVLSLDNAAVGNAVSNALLSSNKGTHVHGTGPAHSKFWLGWHSFPETEFNSSWSTNEALAAAKRAVEKEHAWAVVVVKRDATAELEAALQGNGADQWVPEDTISVVYSQARNELAAGNFVVPLTTAILQNVSLDLRREYTTNWLANSSNTARVSETPIDLLVNPVSYTMVNLHPYDIPLATALTFVGLIYVMVFAFQTSLITTNMQVIVASWLNTRSLILVRLAISFWYYWWISWSFAILGVAFRGDFYRHFGGGGFMLYWLALFLSITAIGLSLQSVVTLVTTLYLPPFFILILLTNVSVSLLPFDLLPSVFQYGKAWPAYNVNRAVRTILFGTKNDLSLNFGILLAWIALNLITLPLFQVWVRRREQKALEKSK